eukprot:6564010-Alexandrium_andersonii.AAC.1
MHSTARKCRPRLGAGAREAQCRRSRLPDTSGSTTAVLMSARLAAAHGHAPHGITMLQPPVAEPCDPQSAMPQRAPQRILARVATRVPGHHAPVSK